MMSRRKQDLRRVADSDDDREEFRVVTSVAQRDEVSPEKRRRLDNIRRMAAARREEESVAAREERLEAMRLRYEQLPYERRQERLAAMREREAGYRREESPEGRERRLEAMREREAGYRREESPEGRERRLEAMRVRYEQLPYERREQGLEDRREREAIRQRVESPERRRQRREYDRERQGRGRQRQRQMHRVPLARDTDAVCYGTQKVEYVDIGPLLDPATGRPRNLCRHCNAAKWPGEPAGNCCNSGKVNLPAIFEDQPEVFKELWRTEDEEGKTFRKYSRQLNNAFALASLRANQPEVPGGGYRPSVAVQGKVFILMGPLCVPEGKTPAFAQLYVLDPDHAEAEMELRWNNMYLPNSVSDSERTHLQSLMTRIRAELAQCNGYVHDIQHAAEIIGEDNCESVKLVIDESKRPDGEHARRYNQGYKEISVAMTDDDSCSLGRALVVRMRGEGNRLEEVANTHRSADPLHFVLLLPNGADGWHMGMEKGQDGTKSVTPLQFYNYHMQIRVVDGEDNCHPLHRANLEGKIDWRGEEKV